MPLARNTSVGVDVDDLPIVTGAGSAAPASALQVGGSDGTNLRILSTDTGGRLRLVGAVADGAAAAGVNPVIVAGVDGAGDTQQLNVDTAGRLQVSTIDTPAGTGTSSNVAASATNVTILAANAARLGAIIVNDGNRNLYAKFGATASTTSYTVKIPANGYYEVPFGYTGIIDGIWDSANGSARITELSA